MFHGQKSSFQPQNCSLFNAQLSCRSVLRLLGHESLGLMQKYSENLGKVGTNEEAKSHGCKDRGSRWLTVELMRNAQKRHDPSTSLFGIRRL